MKYPLLYVLLFLCYSKAFSQWERFALGSESGHRSFTVLNDNEFVLSGNKGSVIWYRDGESENISPKGCESMDFRCSLLLKDSVLLIANAGSPTYIFRTTDYGKNWDTVYVNEHPKAFIDAMVLAEDGRIVVFGDQINGHFLFMDSQDGGKTWKDQSSLLPEPTDTNEAGLAASNSTLLVRDDLFVLALSNLNSNRLVISTDGLKTYKTVETDLKPGTGSGVLSFAVLGRNVVMVGGNFFEFDSHDGTAQVYNIDSKGFISISQMPSGYRLSIDCQQQVCVCTGTNGSDVSFDGGLTWEPLNRERFLTVRGHQGKFYLSGPKGAMARYTPSK